MTPFLGLELGVFDQLYPLQQNESLLQTCISRKRIPWVCTG